MLSCNDDLIEYGYLNVNSEIQAGTQCESNLNTLMYKHTPFLSILQMYNTNQEALIVWFEQTTKQQRVKLIVSFSWLFILLTLTAVYKKSPNTFFFNSQTVMLHLSLD